MQIHTHAMCSNTHVQYTSREILAIQYTHTYMYMYIHTYSITHVQYTITYSFSCEERTS